MAVTGEWPLPVLNSWATCHIFSLLSIWGGKWQRSFCGHPVSSQGQISITRWAYRPRSCFNETGLFYSLLSITPHPLWAGFPIHFDLLISLPLPPLPPPSPPWKGPCSLSSLWIFHIRFLACETNGVLVSSVLSDSKLSKAMLQWSVYWFVSSGIWYWLFYPLSLKFSAPRYLI